MFRTRGSGVFCGGGHITPGYELVSVGASKKNC